MNARQQPLYLSVSQQAALAVERHNRVLLNALQARCVVQLSGNSCLIQAVSFQTSGGDIETDVRLVGQRDLIDGALISHSPASWEATETERHERILLHALQTAHQVNFDGLNHFIHTLKFEAVDEGIKTTVWLAGSPLAIDGERITIRTEQSFLQHPAIAGNHSPRGAS